MHAMHFNSARNECGNLFTSAQSSLETPSQRWSRADVRDGVLGYSCGRCRRCTQTRQVAANVRFRDGADSTLPPWTRRVQFPGGIFWQAFLCRHLVANNRAASLVHTATETTTSAASRACVPRREL